MSPELYNMLLNQSRVDKIKYYYLLAFRVTK